MLDIIITTEKDTDTCTELYLKAFASDPWYEDNDLYEVQDYVKAFMSKNDRTLYALSLDGRIIALAFTNTVPCPGHPFLRIEDFCIDPDYIRLGLGSQFLALIEQEAKKNNCSCILLATVENSPSQSFYSRNGFAKLENSIYLYKEI